MIGAHPSPGASSARLLPDEAHSSGCRSGGMSQLHLLADFTTFWFTPPAGEPLDLERFGERKRVALQNLLSQR